jgi:HEAT repeats/Prenyltransferase and squalene oxidase repeat
VLAKIKSDVYTPGQHYNYEAGVDAMLLEAVDRTEYLPQLQLIANFLVSTQRASGGWFYPMDQTKTHIGDTSITQYAILGLWAVSRAGGDVPVETWEKAGQWLVKTQCSDGGFAYHPYMNPEAAEFQLPTITMTAAGAGTLLVIRRELFTDVQIEEPARPSTASRKFGVLERFQEVKPQSAPKAKKVTTMSASSIDKAQKEGVKWLEGHFTDKSKQWVNRPCYYLYCVERVAALLDVEKIGSHDWYEFGSDELVLKQLAGGNWVNEDSTVATTALGLLFLSKATASIVPKVKKAPMVGGGLLVGGRGLPDKLDEAQVRDGQTAAKRQRGPVDGLLAELESSGDAKVEAVQAAVVEAVQLDRPEELIAQVDRLKKLAVDTRVEVRRTAMWALGRTGNISVAPVLIAGLKDVDENVAREASVGLSILSRRPDGCGLPLEPSDGLVEDATPEVRKSHIEKWQKESADLWQKWYLRVRPYDERDDRAMLKRKS